MSYTTDTLPPKGIPYSKPSVRVKPDDEVKVMVFDNNGAMVFTYTARGFHNIETAIDKTFEVSGISGDIRDYTFRVTNIDTAATELYRINAHGHLHLII